MWFRLGVLIVLSQRKATPFPSANIFRHRLPCFYSFLCFSEVFLAGDYGECHSHPLEACFSGGGGDGGKSCGIGGAVSGLERGEGQGLAGYYPCCRQPAYR